MLTWYFISKADYLAIETYDSNALYFTTDTHEIFRGAVGFTEAIILYDGTDPAVKAVNRLYINSTTLEGKVWDGTAWTTVIKAVATTLGVADTSTPVSGKAVADYVQDQISAITGSDGLVADLTYNASAKKIVVAMADGTTTKDLVLSNLGTTIDYNQGTGALTLKDVAGTTLATVNLDLERFVTEASYDPETKSITLSFNDDSEPLVIDVSDLVDVYTVANTGTVNMTMTNNQITANVNISTETDNVLELDEDGKLYVRAHDSSAQMDLVENATAGNLAGLDGTGQATDSGVAPGGAALNATPNAATLATEAAVAAVRTALQTAIDAKMGKVAAAAAGQVIIASSAGDAEASGKSLGGATFAATPNATTLATEAGVAAYTAGNYVAKTQVIDEGLEGVLANASKTDVASEYAVVEALTWKTSV